MDEDSRFELREQKMRLDREFGEMLSKIANRKDMLVDLEKKLAAIDKTRQAKEEDLRTLERKLVVLLEDQQKELNAIRRKQDVRGALLAASHSELSRATTTGVSAVAKGGTAGGIGGGGYSGGPSLQEKKQAAQLMQSTETLMKFGFMSMSMTYFSSLNMIKALRTVSAQDTVMAALADVHAQRAVGLDTSGGLPSSAPKNPLVEKEAKVNRLKPGQLPGQQTLQVSSWSVEDVAKWLQTLSLGQYSEAFIDSAVDGEFLYDLTDDDLKNTLGIEHRLHRKKILNCVNRLKMAEAQNESRLGVLQNTLFNPDVSHIALVNSNFTLFIKFRNNRMLGWICVVIVVQVQEVYKDRTSMVCPLMVEQTLQIEQWKVQKFLFKNCSLSYDIPSLAYSKKPSTICRQNLSISLSFRFAKQNLSTALSLLNSLLGTICY
jgi:hypothetical protein